MTDRKFDWISHHDERSKNYRIADKVGLVTPVKKYWTPGVVLDQGSEGACVGFGWTGEALASPKPFKTDSAHGSTFAQALYERAKVLDAWEGENYDGTSVIAGAKAVVEKGYIEEYRWAFSIEELRSAIIMEGPAVIGIPWYDSMYETRPSGLVEVSGSVVGGHCIVLTGYNPRVRIRGEKDSFEVFRWKNSWGPSYGLSGTGYIKAEDLAALLKNDGEACIPVNRKTVRF